MSRVIHPGLKEDVRGILVLYASSKGSSYLCALFLEENGFASARFRDFELLLFVHFVIIA